MQNYVEFMRNKCEPIQVDDGFFSNRKAGHRNLRVEWRDFLGPPIAEEGLKAVLSKVACNNAPEREGICIEIFKVNWDSINGDILANFNQMFLDVRIIEQQKHGIVVCIPKNDISTTPAEFRQFTLLNTQYKIPARIRRSKLKHALCFVHPSQYFGLQGTTIFDALTTVRSPNMYADLTHSPLRNLSFYFIAAFDRISHTYLLLMLKCYGYGI